MASIGPRLFSRGKHVPLCSTRPRESCFNWAAAFQPRKGSDRRGNSSRGRCFNWAAAFQPRKDVVCNINSMEQCCFNWAAAFQPRKGGRAPRRAQNSGASIGPRLFSRGKLLVPRLGRRTGEASIGPRLFSRGKSYPKGTTTLRCGGFNWAAAFQPRKGEPHRNLVGFGIRASIGPRLFSRGKGRGAGQHSERDRASIGPRLFSRGKNQRRCSAPKNTRRFNWAAAFQPRKARRSYA